ncbi:MAG: zincin-like metallopeptidase domain-containing protein [Terracidiphilus sp.]
MVESQRRNALLQIPPHAGSTGEQKSWHTATHPAGRASTRPLHSSGHESRLNRTFGDRFGDELYSKEELVAEMGAAFLCAIAGISNEHTDRNTTAYIQNWIEKLEEDNRLIVHAAANAQRAVDLILRSTFEEENETSENAGDAAVSGIPPAVAVNIAPAIYGHAHL